MLYGLYLNMMRDLAERIDLVAVAESPERLVEWMEEQKADKEYQDGSTSAFGGLLTKTFRPGTALEYYNPPSSLELNKINSFNDGIWSIPSRQDYMEGAGQDWDLRFKAKMI